MRKFIDIICEAQSDIEHQTCSCHFGSVALCEAFNKDMNYDLDAKYAEFNAKFFEGKLPADCALIWKSPRKGVSGLATVKVRRTGYDMQPVSGTYAIEITDKFVIDENHLDKLLLHEMIHIHFYTLGGSYINEGHGPLFKAMLKKIGDMAGFEIPLSDEIDAPLRDTKTKKLLILQLDTTFGLLSPSILNGDANKEQFIKDFKKACQIKKTTGHAYLIDNSFFTREAASIPVKRKFGGFKFGDQKITQTWLDELENHDPIISFDGKTDSFIKNNI